MIAFSFSETFPFRIDIIIHHKERKINRFLVILSNIGALHKLEYLFLWKYFKKQVAFCRKRFPLLRNRFHMLRSFHGKSHHHPPLFFSTLSPCGGGIHPSRGVCRHYAIHFFVELQGPHLCGPCVPHYRPFPGKPRAAYMPPLQKGSATVSTACCLIYLLYTLSQVFVDSRILTW